LGKKEKGEGKVTNLRGKEIYFFSLQDGFYNPFALQYFFHPIEERRYFLALEEGAFQGQGKEISLIESPVVELHAVL
jgi:hypothetical protein